MFSTDGFNSSDSEPEFGLSNERKKGPGLAGLFGGDVQKNEEREENEKGRESADSQTVEKGENREVSPSTRPITVLSSVVHCFQEDSDGQFLSIGKLGLALIETNEQLRLLLYTPEKKAVVQKIIDKDLHFHFQHPYIYFTIDNKRWSISFDGNNYELMKETMVWLTLFSMSPVITVLNEGSGHSVDYKDSVMITVETVTCKDHKLIKNHEESRHKLKQKTSDTILESVHGMKKGEIKMMYRDSSVLIITLKKVKFVDDSKNNKDNSHEDTPSISAQEEKEAEISESLQLKEEESSNRQSLVERMAKIGKPMILPGVSHVSHEAVSDSSSSQTDNLPTLPLPAPRTQDMKERVKENEEGEKKTESESEEERVVVKKEGEEKTETDTESPPSYPFFHRVVGVEIDRLEMRMQSFLKTFLEEKFAGIERRLDQIESTQQQILREFRPTADTTVTQDVSLED